MEQICLCISLIFREYDKLLVVCEGADGGTGSGEQKWEERVGAAS